MEDIKDNKSIMIDIPSYTDFSKMDKSENDPEDVAEILEICEGE